MSIPNTALDKATRALADSRAQRNGDPLVGGVIELVPAIEKMVREDAKAMLDAVGFADLLAAANAAIVEIEQFGEISNHVMYQLRKACTTAEGRS